ncbi:hypothetical protein GALMADRAFT_269180 [Galerina marginata CBS 339.88]|uniref:HD domain-containing protein n=1 Tax=Galerina marginata (strain CBS 339.88) TaxID=685588 RepID=A0A067SVZ5_GALM3|nr:hypothetical protein GALMADRAFT_269180 [Galerina marginata CBS 339.88]
MDISTAVDYSDEVDAPEDDESSSTRLIKDPIHGYIPISANLARYIDSKQFQRLRNIKQLGTSSYVWPSASHTRFEHCLGVAYLSRLMATGLQKKQPALSITDRDVECVEIAGLCHDLGHGPWSHVWDGLFIPRALPGKKWQHEDGSEMMFDALVKENDPERSLEDQNFIKALIAGDHKRTPHEKPFLFDIVANKRNGLDVDKFDYIHRDSHMIGEPIHLSLERLVKSARVLDDQICYNIKDANHIYDICGARFKLHKAIYNHKTAKAIEYMIIDALLSADKHLKIAERVFDPKAYLHLTDWIMPQIEASTEPELEEARAIFDRIRTRQLFKCVDYKVIDWPMRNIFFENITPEKIVEAARALSITVPSTPTPEAGDALSTTSSSDALQVDDVIVDFSIMHYGMKEKNPVDFVRFYSKSRPTESMEAGPGVYSNLRPTFFAEDLLRVYTKDAKFYGLVQAGYRAILAELEARNSPPAITIITDPTVPTPPATEAPSTPTAHSRTSSFTFTAAGGSGSASTPFANNAFTTVSPSFAPPSPTRAGKKPRGTKRAKPDTSASTSGASAKKRK